MLIPNPQQQAAIWQQSLESGEQLQTTRWFEQRLPLLIAILLEQGAAIAELIFSAMRHRYFGALTDRRVLMGSTGWHDPIPTKVRRAPARLGDVHPVHELARPLQRRCALMKVGGPNGNYKLPIRIQRGP